MIIDKPFVDVCLATYNGDKYLTQQLDSILEQTYENFKIYICDDKSTDNTVKMCKEYPIELLQMDQNR